MRQVQDTLVTSASLFGHRGIGSGCSTCGLYFLRDTFSGLMGRYGFISMLDVVRVKPSRQGSSWWVWFRGGWVAVNMGAIGGCRGWVDRFFLGEDARCG